MCKWGSGCTLSELNAPYPYFHRIKAYLATWTKVRPCPSRVSRSIVFASRRAFTTSNCPLATAPIRGLSPHTALRLGEVILGCFRSLRTQLINNSSSGRTTWNQDLSQVLSVFTLLWGQKRSNLIKLDLKRSWLKREYNSFSSELVSPFGWRPPELCLRSDKQDAKRWGRLCLPGWRPPPSWKAQTQPLDCSIKNTYRWSVQH